MALDPPECTVGAAPRGSVASSAYSWWTARALAVSAWWILVIAGALLLHTVYPLRSEAADAKRWTVLVYMAADNDLEPFSIINMKQAELGLPESGVETLVFVDRAKDNNGAGGSWSGGRLYRILPNRAANRIGSTVVKEYGPVDSGSPAFLSRLVEDVFSSYPAQRRGLILWNHGGGWSSLLSDEGEATRTGTPTGMSLPEAAEAIRGGLKRSGQPKLDFLGLDMCLMAQLEAVAEFSDTARVLVASQAIEPGLGWSYEHVMRGFGESLDARQVANRVVDSFHAANQGRGEKVSTLSAIDLDQSARLISTFSDLVRVWDDNLDVLAPALIKSFFWAEGYATGGKLVDFRSRTAALASVDILDALTRIEANLGPSRVGHAEINAFRTAFTSAVLNNKTSPWHAASKGLAIHAPVRKEQIAANYAAMRLPNETRWLPFLERLAAAAARSGRPPRVESVEFFNAVTHAPLTSTRFGDDAIAKTTVTGDNILYTNFRMDRVDARSGRRINELVGFLYDTGTAESRAAAARELAEFVSPDYAPTGATMQTDAAILSIVALTGRTISRPSLDGTILSSDGKLMVQAFARVQRAGQDPIDTVIVFDLATSEVAIVRPLPQQGGTGVVPRVFSPQPTDTVTFLAIEEDASGRRGLVPAGPGAAWGEEGPRLLFDLPIPGRYTFAISATSISGATDNKTVEIDVGAPAERVSGLIGGGRSMTPARLFGEWSRPDGTRVMQIGPGDGRGGLSIDWLDIEERRSLREAGIKIRGRLDTTLLPTLDIFWEDQSGKLIKSETSLLFADAGFDDRIFLRTLLGRSGDARGQLLELRRAKQGTPVAGLVGTWIGRMTDGSMVTAYYSANGSFRQETASQTDGLLVLTGRWSLRDGHLAIDIEDAAPRQLCRPREACRTVQMGRQYLPFTLLDGNRLKTPAVELTRSGPP
jgi:hypothetical protein